LDVLALMLGVVSLLMLFIRPLKEHCPWRTDTAFLLLLLANIFLAIIPSAMTNSEIPHALRMDGGWPFLCLLTGYFIVWLQRYSWPIGVAVLFAGILFFLSYSKDYFKRYPEESKGMFSFWTLDEVKQIKTDEDWAKFMVRYYGQDYHFRYFLMHHKGYSCKESRVMWINMLKFLKKEREVLGHSD
jgi:hypothetical protein